MKVTIKRGWTGHFPEGGRLFTFTPHEEHDLEENRVAYLAELGVIDPPDTKTVRVKVTAPKKAATENRMAKPATAARKKPGPKPKGKKGKGSK